MQRIILLTSKSIASMSSGDESEENKKEESAVHKIYSQTSSTERERAQAAARVSAYSILTSGQKLTAEQKRMLLMEHKRDVAMRRRERTTALQEIYDIDTSRCKCIIYAK